MDVLRAIDFGPADNHCVFGWENCDERNPCPLHPEWAELKKKIEQWARSRTLEDVRRGDGSFFESGARPAGT